ncbi:BRCT domain-containing protein [Oceanimonas sp. AH20CE76]|uniref:BRCT domain-containing protein n=1 Tax=Oceanimonas sp. AH20CE76 TaxID=2977120 RepID=UPI0031FE7366
MELHEVPKAFSYRRNKEKHLLGLHGILSGLSADKELTEAEILFLDTWLRTDSDFKQDGDFLDIQDLITDILEDGIITQDEMDDLTSLVTDVLEYGGPIGLDEAGLINQFFGFLQGISADGVVSEQEVLALNELLNTNKELLSTWPGNLVAERVNHILEDGVITDEEREDLKELVHNVTGQRFLETGLACGLSTEFCTDQDFDGPLEGLKVCFSGKFMSGPRTQQEKLAIQAGMTISKNVTQSLNLLVIGTIASRDWKFSSHGRKIEAAIRARSEGQQLKIINEETWRGIAGATS